MSKKKTWAQRVEALVKKLGSVELVAGKLGVSWRTVKRWREEAYQPSRLAQNAIENLEKS